MSELKPDEQEIEKHAIGLFSEKYPNYQDPTWCEVSEKCRASFRRQAKKNMRWSWNTRHKGSEDD